MSALLSMKSRDIVLSESDSADFVVGQSAGWADAMKRARLVAPTTTAFSVHDSATAVA